MMRQTTQTCVAGWFTAIRKNVLPKFRRKYMEDDKIQNYNDTLQEYIDKYAGRQDTPRPPPGMSQEMWEEIQQYIIGTLSFALQYAIEQETQHSYEKGRAIFNQFFVAIDKYLEDWPIENLLYDLPDILVRAVDDVSNQFSQEELDLIKGFIRQGPTTNTFTKIKSNNKNTSVDPITGTATITKGNLIVTIPNFRELTDLRTSTHQLLDTFTMIATNGGMKNFSVSLPLEDYMEMRNLKDRKAAREQVDADLKTLYNISISATEKVGNYKEKSYSNMRVCDANGVSKHGVISFTFGAKFFELLKSYRVMPVQRRIWTINAKKNPYSYYLLRRIMEHKNMNVGKKNEDIISVKTLLGCMPGLPSIEEVLLADRAVKKRIITPFERDMNALTDTLTWEYCQQKKKPFTPEELKHFDYNTFSNAYISIHWLDYPDQTERLERKKQKQAEREEKKRKQQAKLKKNNQEKNKN